MVAHRLVMLRVVAVHLVELIILVYVVVLSADSLTNLASVHLVSFVVVVDHDAVMVDHDAVMVVVIEFPTSPHHHSPHHHYCFHSTTLQFRPYSLIIYIYQFIIPRNS